MSTAHPPLVWIPWLTIAEPTEDLPEALLLQQVQHQTALISQPWPSTKQEAWKYADLRCLSELSFVASKPLFATEAVQVLIEKHRLANSALIVCVNGYWVPDLSDLALLPRDVEVCSLMDAWRAPRPEMEKAVANVATTRYPFASLNVAMSAEGLLIHVPANCQVTAPVQLLSIVTETHPVLLSPQHHVIVGENSQLTLLEDNIAMVAQPYFSNRATFMTLHRGARCEHYKIQREGSQARQLAHLQVDQFQDSQFASTQFAIGGEFARDEIVVQLREAGAVCDTAGFYRLQRDNQFVDHHIDIQHIAPHTRSNMLYKGTLDQRSRAVFNGRVYVQSQAAKIEAHQANHHLLLSSAAEAYSKPELEIYADDVKCKHGASTGQIDADALFYLRSRGFTHEEAVQLLLRAFGDNVFARLSIDGLKAFAEEAMYA